LSPLVALSTNPGGLVHPLRHAQWVVMEGRVSLDVVACDRQEHCVEEMLEDNG
jgi:hypothetical protein